jgi:two-component system, sensor histidine kinase and response regulator
MSCNHPAPIDIEAAKEIVDGDAELFSELMEMFLESAPSSLEGLRESIENGNMPEARRRAHQIKGSLKNFAAIPGIAGAQAVEDAAERGDRDEAEKVFRELADEIEYLGYYYLKKLWKEHFYE